jgi:UDP-glucose 4-epimerase
VSVKSNLLVTGGAGFIGSHLVERLLADGHSVNPDFVFIESKISRCDRLEELVRKSSGIYHLAAAVGVELVMAFGLRTLETNLRETQLILDAASAHHAPILLASTSEVYGRSRREAFGEEDDLLIGPPHLSRWGYACSKLMDEFLALAHAKEHGTPVVVARLFNTVGPRQTGQYGMVLPRFVQAAQRGQPLKVFGDGRQSRCFCDVGDTVEALVRLQGCAAARGEIFNVGNPEEISIGKLAEKVIEQLHSSSVIEYIPYEKAYGPGFQDMLRRKPIIDKLARFVGFRPATRLDEIIEKTDRYWK